MLVRDDNGDETRLRKKFEDEKKQTTAQSMVQYRAGALEGKDEIPVGAFDQKEWTFMHALVLDIANEAPAIRIRGAHTWLTSAGYQDWLHPLSRLAPFDADKLPTVAVAEAAVRSIASKVGLTELSEEHLGVRLPGLTRPSDPSEPHYCDDADEELGRTAPRLGADILFCESRDSLPGADRDE